MSETRPTRAEQRRRTQERILRAATRLFAETGYERTTIRAVAAAAETDPSLVMRYFGSKEELFARVAVPEPDAPISGTPEQAAEQLLAALAAKIEGEPDTATLAAIRTMLTHSDTAESVREAMTARQRQAAGHLGPDDAELRAGLIGALTIGVVISRHLLHLDSVGDADPDRIVELLRPAFHEIAHGDTDRNPAS
ncbi:TetR/AcrR family transcriptional regulator [Nocardia jinanensis]|uniref:TetR family transcriptional regulator n=1 Tax=Nocardia jinanensis TaxID=382504 RepID=A0A917RGU2_9NOCA|nr:TetR/AcrR family transcriptional regulator [Nocardia jinanensis]GGL07155.1 TetR family transcriptional regulator [Nocardia jinanensis]